MPAEYTETICMHFICTNVLRHTICNVQGSMPLYLCNVCEALTGWHSMQCTKIRIVDFSAHVALFVCELLGDLQTLPPAVTQSCLRWASSAPAPWTSGPLKPSDLLLLGITHTRSSGRRHFEGTLKPSDPLFLSSSRTSKISLRLCDGSGGVWQSKSVARLSAFCLQTCLQGINWAKKMFQR